MNSRATGSSLDLAVDGHGAFADKLLGLASGVGEASGFHGLSQRDVFAAEGQGWHGMSSLV